jgi:hypothetical protein
MSMYLNARFKPLLESSVRVVQNLMINCCHFLLDCLLQIGQCEGIVGIDT